MKKEDLSFGNCLKVPKFSDALNLALLNIDEISAYKFSGFMNLRIDVTK